MGTEPQNDSGFRWENPDSAFVRANVEPGHPSLGTEPQNDSVKQIAMDAATRQFQRMSTSNPWDYARAIVNALRMQGRIVEDPDDG